MLSGAPGVALVALLVGTALLRIAAFDRSRVLVFLNAFTLWLYLPAYVIGVVALLTRQWALLAITLALGVAHVRWVLLSARRPSRGSPADPAPTFRLVSANIFPRNRQLDRFVDELEQLRPDVLFLQELTDRAELVISRSHLRDALPYSFVPGTTDIPKTAIYSSFPLDDARSLEAAHDITTARVSVDGQQLRLYNVHVLPPRWFPQWRADLTRLAGVLEREPGPTVAAGDFNVTCFNRPYALMTSGRLRDAFRDHGRWLATTWRHRRLPLPPLRLDHVLLSPCVTCRSISVGRGAGSDHRPVVVDLTVRPRSVRQS